MTGSNHSIQQLRAVVTRPARQVEGGLRVVLGQNAENLLRVTGCGTVVEGERDDLLGRLDALNQVTCELERAGFRQLVCSNACKQESDEHH